MSLSRMWVTDQGSEAGGRIGGSGTHSGTATGRSGELYGGEDGSPRDSGSRSRSADSGGGQRSTWKLTRVVRQERRMEPDDGTRVFIVIMSAALLVAVLIAVIGMAKYDALVSETRVACHTAAALDLTGWVDLCKRVQFQE